MTAAVLFALAAALAVGPSPGRALRRLTPPPEVRGQRRPVRMVVLACIGVGLVTVLLGVRVGGWVAAFAVVATTALWLVRGARDDRRRIRRKAAVARAARTLALLLQAGHVPAAALEDAASDCPVLAPAALTGRWSRRSAGSPPTPSRSASWPCACAPSAGRERAAQLLRPAPRQDPAPRAARLPGR